MLDHSGHSNVFPSKLINFNFGKVLPLECQMFVHIPNLCKTFLSSTLGERSREFRHLEECLSSFRLGLTSKLDFVKIGLCVSLIALAHSNTPIFFGIQLKGDLSRAFVE